MTEELRFWEDDTYVYGLTDGGGWTDATGTFTPEEAARIRAAETEWWAVQELIRGRVTETPLPERPPA